MCSCGGRGRNSSNSKNNFSNLTDDTLRKKLSEAKKYEAYEKAAKIHAEMVNRGLVEVAEAIG